MWGFLLCMYNICAVTVSKYLKDAKTKLYNTSPNPSWFLCTTMAPIITISTHTTSSSPRPHILYNIRIATKGGRETVISRRYSEVVVSTSPLLPVSDPCVYFVVRDFTWYCLGSCEMEFPAHLKRFVFAETLKDPFVLPPKRLLTTTFIPSAWIDNALIAERKDGLAKYLNALLSSPDYAGSSTLADFITPNSSKDSGKLSPEDALPSTLSRKAAMNLLAHVETTDDVKALATPIAAAYYPDWSTGTNPPEGIDFSKFDILFFGDKIFAFRG